MNKAIILALLSGAAAPGAPLQPGAPHPIQLNGPNRFESIASVQGRPVCIELWDFHADGTVIVRSGEEIVTQRYRVEEGTRPVSRAR